MIENITLWGFVVFSVGFVGGLGFQVAVSLYAWVYQRIFGYTF